MHRPAFIALCAGLLIAACASPAAVQDVRPLDDILAASPASDWRPVDPGNTLYLELPRGRVVIELASGFAPRHAANIRALARAHYFDGAAVLRSQDNYVVQWGRDDDDPAPLGEAAATLTREITRPRADAPFTPLQDADTYAPQTGFADGFPAARNEGEVWLAHCYGMVGSARDVSLDSGNGGQLYVVIGQSPRHLDRNITLVGRVLQGMELLSVMPRGTGELGFYETLGERTPIRSRIAADVPAAERTPLEVLRTDSATFAEVLESRRTRRDAFFAEPVGRINVCNAPLPVRAAR